MKPIQPLTIWLNGQNVIADILNISSAYDNILDTATFSWQLYSSLLDVSPTLLINGNLTIQGQEYIDWNASGDVNQAAYIWVSEQLNVTLI
jgi:hypothetical protein